MIEGMTLPASLDVERTVLGSLMNTPSLTFTASASLAAEDFLLDSNRKIYRSIIRLADAGKPIGLIEVMEELRASGELEAIGNATYLSGLTDAVNTRKDIEWHIGLLRDKAQRRQIINELNVALERAFGTDTTTEEISTEIQAGLFRIASGTNRPQAKAVGEYLDEVLSEIQRLRAHRDGLIGVPTGLETLDMNIGGYRKGEMIVIGARPGQGKTALMTQSAAECGRNDIPDLVFSQEMSKEELLKRILADETGIPFWKIHNPRYMNDQEAGVVAMESNRLRHWPLYVDDAAGMDISEITARTRLMIRQHSIKCVYIDYLQLVRSKGKDERERMNVVSESLRQLAKQEQIPVVCLSQLARPKDGNENERPTMYRLKETGKIEQDAHTILLLYRPVLTGDSIETGKRAGEFSGEDEIIIAKQRNGPTGHEKVSFIAETMSFKPRTTEITQ